MLELHGLVEIVQTLEESTAHTLERCGVAWERLDREEAERRFPIRVPEGSFVVTQPEAGIARADKALAAFRRELDVREGDAVHPDELDADVVVVTAGSWVNELLDEPLPVKTTRETLCYFRPDAGGRPVPSVVSFKPGRHTHDMYSLYDPVYGLKVGAHHAGPEADPNVPGEPDPELIERITAWANDDLPARRARAGRRPRRACTRPRQTRASSSSAAAASSSARPARATASSSRRRSASDSPTSRPTRRLTILPPCPSTSDSARFRASGTSSSATTGRC